MKGNFKATAAIALLDSTKLAAPEVKRFGSAVAAEFCEIARTETMNSMRAVLTGMALPILKASMPRGEFTPWMKANLTQGKIWTEGTAIKNASFYTRLAHKIVEEARLTGDDVLALTEGNTVRGEAGKAREGAGLLQKIEKVIAGRTITELLEDYGIKSGSGSGSGKVIEISSGKDDPLLADTAAHLVGLREIILNADTLKRFTAKQLDDIERQIAALPEEFRKLLAKLRS
jgi:hypothetical protein